MTKPINDRTLTDHHPLERPSSHLKPCCVHSTILPSHSDGDTSRLLRLEHCKLRFGLDGWVGRSRLKEMCVGMFGRFG